MLVMTEDYSNYPKSVSELKSDRTENASDWTPRDVLLCALRAIDSGEIKPTVLAVSYRQEHRAPEMIISSPDPLVTIGMLQSNITSVVC
jgi:hypothetical protein